MKPNCALPSFNFTRAARILGACNIIEPKVFMKRKLSLIYLNERSKITMNVNFELFNISRSSFLRYLDLCNMQTNITANVYTHYLENEVYHSEYSTKSLETFHIYNTS